MTNARSENTPRLWTRDGFRQDDWRHCEGVEALQEERGKVILPLSVWRTLDPAVRTANSVRLGVLLLPADALSEIAADLAEIPLVALAFPAFNDGRSFSKAALLRGRHDYRGVLRACGQILIDQIPLMMRTGFSEFEVSDRTALARLSAGRLGGLPLFYQPAAEPAAGGAGYAWRRRPLERRTA
jgi:uncharacterized protein (DUF934 family)